MLPPTSRGSLSLAALLFVEILSFWRNGSGDSNNWYQSVGLRVRILGGLLHSVGAEPLVGAEGDIVDLVTTSFRIRDMFFLLPPMDPCL